MRAILGALTATACVVLLAGCGSSSSSVVSDPGDGPVSDPAGVPVRTPGPIAGADVLPLISMTGAGGRPAASATLLSSAPDLASFERQFRSTAIGHRIRAAIGDRLGSTSDQVVAQVVAVGCDVPPHVHAVTNKEGDVELVPGEVASPLEECLAPVTTVAIAVLPRS